MIKYIEKGDIFALENIFNYAHGCNCAGAMGKGIALQFRNKYPEMYQEYKMLCKTDRFTPGQVSDYNYGNGHIYNLATQNGIKSIALPAIGAGLGGLSCGEVKENIENIASEYPNIDLYIVESYFKTESDT